MKYLYFFLFSLVFTRPFFSQDLNEEIPFKDAFTSAYTQNQNIPKGILEAISFVQTRFTHLDESLDSSCTGMPRYLTCMGLIENGKSYFNPTLLIVAQLSNTDEVQIKQSAEMAIHAYAAALQELIIRNNYQDSSVSAQLSLLRYLTEIPVQAAGEVNNFAYNSFLFELIRFLNNTNNQVRFGFPHYKIDTETFFGTDRYAMLSAGHILVFSDAVTDTSGNKWVSNNFKSADYIPAIWNAAAACNFSSRAGTPVSAVTIHTVQGSYSGCISWFQNCSASVSAHYVLRSSDGQVTQMVLESDKAWHVGTENPYTIGLEHEGYIDNPSWYTSAMYASSAALVSDITNSGYGIDPIRTAWWPWTASTNYNASSIPGSCSKIKGHQHYPNQTHTDPGINWDWNRYFKLIHPTPTPQIFTTLTGTLTDPGGAGNYANDQRFIYTIQPIGANTVTVSFTMFNLENTWDYLYIYDGADISSALIGYYTGTTSPGIITSSGNAITLEFRSDCATTAPGFELNWTSDLTPPPTVDNISPSTAISTSQTWETADFFAQFLDEDNVGGSGLEKAYYAIADFDGNEWRANGERGFFNETFDASTINNEWAAYTGTWVIGNGEIKQTDESLSNTNISAYLRQDLSNRYMYHFTATIEGSQADRRTGFHFFADSASLPNRGNGYFAWFRLDGQVLQLYKVSNDVFTMIHSKPLSLNASQWYDFKIIYDRIAGKISVYIDNMLITTYTDPSPYNNGKYISFRSGNAIWRIKDLRVYRSRYANTSTNILVGNCIACDIRYQNPSPANPSGKIFSIVTDSATNLSSITSHDINVDWTAPESFIVQDGITSDIDTTTSSSFLQYNWDAANDSHSDINRYFYAVGSSPGDSNIINWTDNWLFLSADDIFSLTPGTTYYIQVTAKNGAGLSTTSISDGQLYWVNDASLDSLSNSHISLFPNPAKDYISLSVSNEESGDFHIYLIDNLGKIIFSNTGRFNASLISLPIPGYLANDTYILYGEINKRKFVYKIIIQH